MTDNGAGAAMEPEHDDGDHAHDADGNVVVRIDDAPQDGDPADPAIRPALEAGDASLLALVDRLGTLLDRSDLSELSVAAGRTRLLLRKPAAIAPTVIGHPAGGAADDGAAAAGAIAAAAGATGSSAVVGGPAGAAEAPARPTVRAPLTGVWYSSPAPGSAPFVAVGREVAVGQVIGLIEAMKLFNEIKSDLAGRVVRVIPDSGALVKAKQPLIEVEPL